MDISGEHIDSETLDEAYSDDADSISTAAVPEPRAADPPAPAPAPSPRPLEDSVVQSPPGTARQMSGDSAIPDEIEPSVRGSTMGSTLGGAQNAMEPTTYSPTPKTVTSNLDGTTNMDGTAKLDGTASLDGTSDLDGTTEVDVHTDLGSASNLGGSGNLDASTKLDGSANLGGTSNLSRTADLAGSRNLDGTGKLDDAASLEGTAALPSSQQGSPRGPQGSQGSRAATPRSSVATSQELRQSETNESQAPLDPPFQAPLDPPSQAPLSPRAPTQAEATASSPRGDNSTTIEAKPKSRPSSRPASASLSTRSSSKAPLGEGATPRSSTSRPASASRFPPSPRAMVETDSQAETTPRSAVSTRPASARSARTPGSQAGSSPVPGSILTNVEKAMQKLDAALASTSPPGSRHGSRSSSRPSSACSVSSSVQGASANGSLAKMRPASAQMPLDRRGSARAESLLDTERVEYRPRAGPREEYDRSKEPSFQRPTSASRARGSSTGVDSAVMSTHQDFSKEALGSINTSHVLNNEPPATIASTTFSKINVEGDPAMLRRARKDAPGTNHKMQQGKLKLVCIDHCTGTPVANVHIHVNTVENQEAGKMKNFSKALGSSSVTDHLGVAVCRLIAGRSYVVTATCDGYHKYGTLGEHLTVSVCSDQVVERNLPMQPIRVTVVVTLRELQPLAGKGIKGDPYGQVHPLDKVPERPKESRIPAPQKVSFYTPAGTRMNFLATTSMQDQTLGVAVRPTADLVERYSTDSEGHCYFYGPRVNGVQPNRMRNTDAPDSGAWWPTAKFHLRANPESGPVRPLFDHQKAVVEYPYHIARHKGAQRSRSPSPTRKTGTMPNNYLAQWPANNGQPDNWPDCPEAETVRQEALTMGDQDPEGIHNFLPQGEYLMSLIDPSRMLIFYTYTGDKEQAQITKAQDAIVPFTMHSMTASQLSNKFDTSPENKVKFPMQLYCRARPWFQVLIIDSVTLEEVGVPFNVKFKIEKVAHHKCIPFRVAKLKAAITEQFKAGNPDPTDCQDCRDDPRALEYILRTFKRGRLADLWSKAELSELDVLHSTGRNGSLQVYNQNMLDDVSSNDMMWNGTATLPFTSNAYEALEHDLYLPMKDGAISVHESKRVTVSSLPGKALDSGGGLWAGSDIALTEDSRDAGSLRMEDGWAPPERTWLTPGDIYSVKVTMEEPFMEMTMRQTRMSNWELEPFVFFALRKVKLMVSAREVFTGGEIPHMKVVVKILDYPRPPRPPVVKPEWCETPEAYFKRVLDQLIDHVVQTRHEAVEERVALTLEAETDADGVATFWCPPKATVLITSMTGDEFESEGATKEMTLTSQADQILALSLQRICYTQAVLLDSETNEGVAGFQVKAYNVTDQVLEIEDEIFSTSSRRKNMSIEKERTYEATAKIKIDGMEPVGIGMTGANGNLLQPFTCRAGQFLKLVITRPADTHLLPEYHERGSGSALVSAFHLHTKSFIVPRRPRVRLLITDSCTAEKVMGVRFRVQCRYVEDPLIPEGESAHYRNPLDWPPPSLDASSAFYHLHPDWDGQETSHDGPVGLGRIDTTRPTSQGEGTIPDTPSRIRIQTPQEQQAFSPGASPFRAVQPTRTLSRLKSQKSVAMVAVDDDFIDLDEGGPVTGRSGRSFTSQKSIHWDGKHRAPWHGSQTGDEIDVTEMGAQSQSDSTDHIQNWNAAEPEKPLDPEALAARALEMMSTMEAGPKGAVDQQTLGGQEKQDVQGPPSKRLPPRPGGRGDGGTTLAFTIAGNSNGRAGNSSGRAGNSSGRVGLGGPYGTGSVSNYRGGSVAGSGGPGSVAGSSTGTGPHDMWAQKSSVAGSVRDARFAEEEAPEDHDNVLGRVWYDTCTGWPDWEDLVIDAGLEVRVEILPSWPFLSDCLAITKLVEGSYDPPEFVFRLPRCDTAFKFWIDRDTCSRSFWDPITGNPISPFPPLARLQPLALQGSLITAQPLPQHEPTPAPSATPTHDEMALGGFDPNGRGGPLGGGGGGGAGRGRGGGAGGGGSLKRELSGIQFSEDMVEYWKVRGSVWQHLRMSDVRYLPLERMRLLSFLAKWGSFPHITGGACKTCEAAVAGETKPFKITPAPKAAWVQEGTLQQGELIPSSDGVGGFFDSSMLRTGKLNLTAKWAYDKFGTKTPKSTGWGSKVGVNHYPKSHNHVHMQNEALYCKGPFFTWYNPDGSAIHVAALAKLYADFIPLLDSTAASLEHVDAHLAKVRTFNQHKSQHGRYVFGNNTVDSCQGGVFVVEDSLSQPYGATLFVLEQIAQLWDYWYSQSVDIAVRVNILLVAGSDIHHMRTFGMHTVEQSNLATIKEWYAEAKQHVARRSRGFLIGAALKEALSLSDCEVPVFILAGGLCDKLKESRGNISSVLHDAQLHCLNKRAMMRPVHTIEMMPVPKLVDEAKQRLRRTQKREGTLAQYDSEEDYPSSDTASNAPSDVPSLSLTEAGTTLAPDIFVRLQESLTESRVRLVDAFNEMDKDGTNSLNTQQLYRMVRRLVPDAGPESLRYLQLMLDADGNNLITYKHLASALKVSKVGGISLQLSEHLEVQMLLVRIAFIMLIENIDADEIFNKYDGNSDGYLDQAEQWRMLKGIFPALTSEEQTNLFGAMAELDIDHDDRISREEFKAALLMNVEATIHLWEGIRDREELVAARLEHGSGPDNVQLQLARSATEHSMLKRVRHAEYPLTQALVKISGATRGSHRRLDMGHALADCELIDMIPIERARARLERNLQQMLDFESQFGMHISSASGMAPPRSSPLASKTFHLTSEPLSPPRSARSVCSASSATSASTTATSMHGTAKYGRSATPERGRDAERATYSPAPRSASSPRSRPRSAGSNTSGLGPLPASSRLLSNTSSRDNYMSEVAGLPSRAGSTSLLGSNSSGSKKKRPASAQSRSQTATPAGDVSAPRKEYKPPSKKKNPSRPISAPVRPRGTTSNTSAPGPSIGPGSPPRVRPRPASAWIKPIIPTTPITAPRQSLQMSSQLLEFDPTKTYSGVAGVLSTSPPSALKKQGGPAGFKSVLTMTTRKPGAYE